MKTIKLDNGDEIELTGLSLDSRCIRPGEVFCACAASIAPAQSKLSKNVKGCSERTHGIAYAGQAINQGATAVLWEPTDEVVDMPEYCQTDDGSRQAYLFKINNLQQKIGQLAANFYDDPSQDMQVIGVTGTNGKTSVTNFIAQILTENDKICGLIGTLGNGIYGKISASSHTTPDAISIQRLLQEIKMDQAETVVIEVSSHALHQHRVADVKFDIAVFMNLTRDHLDYHGTMENYGQTKKQLFLAKSLKTAIVNIDDDFAEQIITSVDRSQVQLIAFSTTEVASKQLEKEKIDTFIYAQNISYHVQGSQFNLCIKNNERINKALVKLPLIGHFNISNALATASALYALGYQQEFIVDALARLKTVSGRMQLINNFSNSFSNKEPNSKKKDIQLIVDYAHTPDALEKALLAIKNHSHKNICCVFGCGGNRDKGKRAEMAKISAKYANQIILTSDNPRDEDPMTIIADIEKGMGTNKNYRVEVERLKAIQLAIDLSGSGDIILVAGKGHEDYQEIKGVRYPYSDIESCQELLAA